MSGEITIINQDRRAGGQTNRITQLTSPRVERTQEAAVTVPGVVSAHSHVPLHCFVLLGRQDFRFGYCGLSVQPGQGQS